ncbi:MAG TPA: ABC transporter ATP-binding protein [Bacteroidetes bacterium]|nr:ABC transporter ATP-binding protein [Bacteroidota bacterium]
MKLLYSYLKHFYPLLILALVLAAVNTSFSMLDPFILGKILDNYALKFSAYTLSQFVKGVGLLLLASMGVAMVSRITKNFQDYFVNVIIQRLGARMYTDGIRHSLELPYEEFEDQRSGETLGRLQKVRSDVEKLMNAFVNVLFTSIVGIVFVTIYCISVKWIIAPIYFSMIPIIGIISSVLSKRIKKIQKTIVAETTSLAGSTTESLRNIELVKSLGLSQQEISRLNSTTQKILKLELKKVRYIRSLSFIQGTIVNFLRTTIIGLMMYLIFTQQIHPGQFVTLLFYSFFIFGPLQELGNIINTYREAEASLENFQSIMNKKPEQKPAHPARIEKVNSISFDQVSFKHQSATQNALTDISFKVNVGDTIAFVGPSGSGKTTLVKLLVGLYSPKQGFIKYNDQEGSNINFDDLRSQIGFVTQDAQLFSGTIRENLLFVNPNATDQECLDVLEKAASHSLLSRADKGLDTVIGEGGMKVSGGEKQRLSIARALLRDPNLIVFDEATSALDSLTEEEITATIRDISDNRKHITILIAHRLSTIMHADKIFVLENGKISESGKHAELLETKGLYYAMWRQQIGERKRVMQAAV